MRAASDGSIRAATCNSADAKDKRASASVSWPSARRVSWRPGRRCERPRTGPSGPPPATAPMPRTSGHSHLSPVKCIGECLGGLAADASGLGRFHPARCLRQRRCQMRAGIGICLSIKCIGELLGGLAADASGLGRFHPARHCDSADAKDERAYASVSDQVHRRASWRPGRRCERPRTVPSGPQPATAPMPGTSGHRVCIRVIGRVHRRVSWRRVSDRFAPQRQSVASSIPHDVQGGPPPVPGGGSRMPFRSRDWLCPPLPVRQEPAHTLFRSGSP